MKTTVSSVFHDERLLACRRYQLNSAIRSYSMTGNDIILSLDECNVLLSNNIVFEHILSNILCPSGLAVLFDINYSFLRPHIPASSSYFELFLSLLL